MVHGRKIFSSRVIEKHQQHQHNLFHNFIDFKKAFDRVWLVGLWRVFKSFNIEEGLFQAIQTICEKASSAVLLNSQLGEFFKTTVGVHHRSLWSPILFNSFLEKIMKGPLHDCHTSISVGGRPIYNL